MSYEEGGYPRERERESEEYLLYITPAPRDQSWLCIKKKELAHLAYAETIHSIHAPVVTY